MGTFTLEGTIEEFDYNYFNELLSVKNDDIRKINITNKYSFIRKIKEFVKTGKWIKGKKYSFDAKIKLSGNNKMEFFPMDKMEIKNI